MSHRTVHASRKTGAQRAHAGLRAAGTAAAALSVAIAAIAFSGVVASAASTGTAASPLWSPVGSTTDVDTVSCATSGYCMIAGEAGTAGFVATINDGAIGRIVSVPGVLDVTTISCPQTNWCLASGLGATVKGIQNDELSIIKNGTPQKAIQIGTNLSLTAGCESSTACFLVGAINGKGLIDVMHAGTFKPTEYPTGRLMSTIACPTSTTCTVVGTNPTLSKPRVAYEVGIAGLKPGAVANAIGGLQDPLGIACTSASSCLVAGEDTTTSSGEVEGFSHGVSGVEMAGVPTITTTACASSTECAAVAVSNKGVLGVVPIASGTPGSFVAVLPPQEDQSLSGVACQGIADCYAVGSNKVSGKLQGIIYRFSL
jgi:hypothetical protein